MSETATTNTDEGTATETRRIVVGYDGSPVALAAVGYAAERVGEDGELIIAHSYSPPPEWQGTPYWDRSVEHYQAYARELFERIPEDLLAGANIEHELMEGPPARSLAELAESRDAEEIVVGSRGFGPFRATLGSVSHALLHEAHRPVVVVPARMLGAGLAARTPHRIVVGYDGSPSARDAISHAAYRATPEGTVVAVHAFRSPFEHYNTGFVAEALAEQRQLAQRTLDEIPQELLGGVPLEQRIVESFVADALVQVAQTEKASEIVVGSRGLGRFAAAVGSSSHAVLHEADRPVVVVPHEPTAEEREYSERVHRARTWSFRRAFAQ